MTSSSYESPNENFSLADYSKSNVVLQCLNLFKCFILLISLLGVRLKSSPDHSPSDTAECFSPCVLSLPRFSESFPFWSIYCSFRLYGTGKCSPPSYTNFRSSSSKELGSYSYLLLTYTLIGLFFSLIIVIGLPVSFFTFKRSPRSNIELQFTRLFTDIWTEWIWLDYLRLFGEYSSKLRLLDSCPLLFLLCCWTSDNNFVLHLQIPQRLQVGTSQVRDGEYFSRGKLIWFREWKRVLFILTITSTIALIWTGVTVIYLQPTEELNQIFADSVYNNTRLEIGNISYIAGIAFVSFLSFFR